MPQLMDRHHFQSLSLPMRDAWTERLRDQWNVELKRVREFWFDGDEITSVTVYKLNSEGRLYAEGDGRTAATEVLGVSA